MPDGLFYPQPETIWDVDGPMPATDPDRYFGLASLEMMTGAKKHMRHVLRQAGLTRLEASRNSVYIETQLRGFHRTRLAESGFVIVPLADWREQREAWAQSEPEKAKFLAEMASDYRASVDRMSAAAERLGRRLGRS
jgi:hypothetical protein